MFTKSLLISFVFICFTTTIIAGGGHDHGHSHATTPVNEETAKVSATNAVVALIEKSKLDKSWATTTISSIEKKEFKGNSEWVAVFVNDKIAETAKKKLYIFLTLGGEYIAANHTGK